jgi:hypothetical protein
LSRFPCHPHHSVVILSFLPFARSNTMLPS